ncbi:MAG: hypothetical protein AB8B94_15940 [Hyphomicrobiales bacterium]
METHEKMLPILKTLGSLLTYGAAFCGILAFVFAFIYPDRFGDAVAAIRGSSDQITESVEEAGDKISGAVKSLEDVTDEGKKETSGDPVKELVNRGYTLDNQSFWRAVKSGDRKAVSLFCSSGGSRFANLSRNYFATFSDYRRDVPDDIWSAVIACPILSIDRACSTRPYNHPTAFEKRFDWVGYKQVCGSNASKQLERNLKKALEEDLEFLKDLCADSRRDPYLGQARFRNESVMNPARHRFGKAVWNLEDLCREVKRY